MEKFSFSELKIEKVTLFTQSPTKMFCISLFNFGECLASCLTLFWFGVGNIAQKLKNEKKSEPTALLLFINFSYAYFRRFCVIIVPGSLELWTFCRTYLRWAILPINIIHTFLPHWKSPYISSISGTWLACDSNRLVVMWKQLHCFAYIPCHGNFRTFECFCCGVIVCTSLM